MDDRRLRHYEAIYKLQNIESYLVATELPRVLNLYGSEIMIKFLDTTRGLLYHEDPSSFLSSSQYDENCLMFFLKVTLGAVAEWLIVGFPTQTSLVRILL